MRTFEVAPRQVIYLPGLSWEGVIVTRYLAQVRVTGDPVPARQLMEGIVAVHQITAADHTSVHQTPAGHAADTRAELETLTEARFTVTELLCDNDHVYVRWRHHGRHASEIGGHPPTGLPLTRLGSTTYRVANSRIAELWTQTEDTGLTQQLVHNASILRTAQQVHVTFDAA